MVVAFSVALCLTNSSWSFKSFLTQCSLASSSVCRSSSDSSSYRKGNVKEEYERLDFLIFTFLVASAHLCQSCGSLLRTSPVAFSRGKNRTQSSGLFLSPPIRSCFTASANSRLPARPQWSGGTVGSLWSRSWRNRRKLACSC